MKGIQPATWLVLAACVGLSACASCQPVPVDELDFRSRAQIEEQDGLRVSASVFSREEARRAFGINLEKRAIAAP